MVGSSVHGQPKEMLQITGLRRTKTSAIAAWVAAVLAIRGALMLYLGRMVVDLGMLMLVHFFRRARPGRYPGPHVFAYMRANRLPVNRLRRACCRLRKLNE